MIISAARLRFVHLACIRVVTLYMFDLFVFYTGVNIVVYVDKIICVIRSS